MAALGRTGRKAGFMKWGIMATGNIAGKFAATLNQMQAEGQILEAVASRNEEKAESFAETYGAAKAYGSYEALLQDDNVEAVYIATPNNLHFENAKMCLMAGKHVLCEKPFTTRAEEAELLYELAQEKGLFIMEAFWIRMLPVLLEMRKIIENGVIGEVKYARSDYGFIAAGERKARKFDSALGGGALLDIGIYNLGFMNMVMGKAPKDFTSEVHFNEYGTDDFSVINLYYENSAVAVVTTAIGMALDRHALVAGTRGTIELDDFQKAERLTVRPYDGEKYIVDISFDINGFEYEIREAGRCIAAGMSASDIYTPQMSLETLRLMDDIRDSWEMKFSYEEI